MVKKKGFIQKLDLTKDSLRNWLKIKKDNKIPKTVLTALSKKKVGSKYKGKTFTSKRKKQVVLAINFSKMKKL
jgi:hypothetical protein|tara:strand:- start:445 stop:663 length:219 start_codon:yes stop_codon:yes gene_type:complete